MRIDNSKASASTNLVSSRCIAELILNVLVLSRLAAFSVEQKKRYTSQHMVPMCTLTTSHLRVLGSVELLCVFNIARENDKGRISHRGELVARLETHAHVIFGHYPDPQSLHSKFAWNVLRIKNVNKQGSSLQSKRRQVKIALLPNQTFGCPTSLSSGEGGGMIRQRCKDYFGHYWTEGNSLGRCSLPLAQQFVTYLVLDTNQTSHSRETTQQITYASNQAHVVIIMAPKPRSIPHLVSISSCTRGIA